MDNLATQQGSDGEDMKIPVAIHDFPPSIAAVVDMKRWHWPRNTRVIVLAALRPARVGSWEVVSQGLADRHVEE